MGLVFEPLCLTIYLGGRCQLDCCYCYAGTDRPVESALPISGMEHALQQVAHNCLGKGLPLTLVFHGANEPLIYRSKIQPIVDMAKSMAFGLGLELILACTTNGIASKSTIQWAVETFDHLTLSWDGPPPIHDRQRSFIGGSGSAMFVEQTAACLSESHRHFTVRTTVTRQSCLFLMDIVKYLGERAVGKVVLHPVYLNRRGTVPTALVPDAGLFALWFLRARRWGKLNGMDVSFPGVRVEAEHAQFCNVLQRNLVVTSDGLITGCFLATCVAASAGSPLFIGAMQKGRTIVSRRHVQRFLDRTHRGFAQCRACFNRSHCAKGCPTACPLIHSYSHAFDCRAERIIGNAMMLERRGIDLTQTEIEKLIDNHTSATPAGGYPIWLT